MAKVFWKGSTLLAPVPPTMVSCGTMEKPNIITVAWTGIVNSQPPMTYISVRPSRYSYKRRIRHQPHPSIPGAAGGLVRRQIGPGGR